MNLLERADRTPKRTNALPINDFPQQRCCLSLSAESAMRFNLSAQGRRLDDSFLGVSADAMRATSRLSIAHRHVRQRRQSSGSY